MWGSASMLHNAMLKNANGKDMWLGDKMGTGISIVVFIYLA